MEKNYVVMTDSSADLNPALEQELGVDIIPLSVNCGDRTFLDYPDEREIKTSEFYGMLRSGANAKTAAANVETFLTAMSRHLEQGKDVLYLGFSSGLSSTYSASEIAAQELRERYPERKVLTVDTLCASMGQGLLVWLTVQELKHGATLEEAAKYAEDNRLHLCHWFTVDDLFFLK
ncbi:MAG: DegV family protein, partial [Oscillospiraceae bacterium]|nr:DegV family protein [Oscillospiraceae bacterium]